jgi:SAM-dependent methyltransferase
VDERVVQRIASAWRLVGAPARPDVAGVERYRLAMKSPPSALVLGATPEVIDMLLRSRVACVVAIEMHAETLEAMRRLASEDWSRVDLVVGDWRDARAAWDSAFDAVLCDGGFMFLAFPDDWRRTLSAVHHALRPGGRLVTRMSAISPSADGFREPYAQAIAAFEAEQSTLDPERRVRRFLELVSHVRGMCRYGAVDAEGRVRLDVATAGRRWIAEDLARRYPEFSDIVATTCGRSSAVGDDGASMVAMPSLERVTAELERRGFDVEVLSSVHRPPKHSFWLAAIRR